MLRAALDASPPATLSARAVIDRDDEIANVQPHSHDLIEMMVNKPAPPPAPPLSCRQTSRGVGDYVTDICELTVYMTEAAVINTAISVNRKW